MVLCSACTSNRLSVDEADYVVSYNFSNSQQLENKKELIESITIVPLQTISESLLGSELQVVAIGDNFLIVDLSKNLITRFSSDGQFLNHIGRHGRGGNEYVTIDNVFVDEERQIHVYSSPNSCEYIYNLAGVFIEKMVVKAKARQIYRNGKTLWAYSGFSNGAYPERLLRIQNDEIVEKYLFSEARIFSFGDISPVFISAGKQLFLREQLTNCIYQIEDNLIHTVYKFDFGKYAIPRDFFEQNDPMKAAHILLDRSFASISYAAQNKDYWLVEADLQDPQRNVIFAYGIGEKKTGKWHWAAYESNDDLSSPLAKHSALQSFVSNTLLGIVDAARLIDSNWKQNTLLANPDVIDMLQETDNPVIICLKLKNV